MASIQQLLEYLIIAKCYFLESLGHVVFIAGDLLDELWGEHIDSIKGIEDAREASLQAEELA